MTFVERFLAFNIQLSDPDRGLYVTTRVKLPKHEQEPLIYFHARLFAFLHSYEPGLQFYPRFLDDKEPALFKKDVVGTYSQWIDVECPSRVKVERALKAHREAAFKIYFYDPVHVDAFCRSLRGSRTNWVSPISFFEMNSSFLEALEPLVSSSSDISAIFSDERLYLTYNESEFETSIKSVNIWDKFQESLHA